MSYRLTEIADEDIARILQDTLDLFGPHQVRAYTALIEQSLVVVGNDPFAPGSMARDELGPGVRTIHLQITARRRGAASHSVYFVAPANEESGPVAILRILHHKMDPQRHIVHSPLLERSPDPSEL